MPSSPSSETISSRTGACQRCHRRKVRCDRKRPSCAPCARINIPCQYAPREHQVQLRRQDVERLEQRLRRLEAENDSLNLQLSDAQRQQSPQHRQDTSRATTSPAASATSEARLPTSTSSLLGLGLHQGQTEPRPPAGHGDVANQVIHLSLSAGGGRNFVGSTSGLFLANLLQPQGQQPPPLISSTQPSNSGPGQAGQRVTASALPPKSLAAEIIEAYCNHDRLHYPFLEPRALHSALENVYRAADGGEANTCTPFEVFLVNMTLAIGTAQVYKLNWNGIWDAEISYNRAAVHLGDVLAHGGITALQALLLICQYRMGTPSQDTTGSVWHLIGVAARMCFELGLHRSSGYAPPRGGQEDTTEAEEEARRSEQETKRRCFWSVVAMDRLASLVLGRPLAIQLDDIEVELPFVDLNILQAASPTNLTGQSLSNAAYGTTEWHLSTAIFVHIVRYRLICGKILNALHRTASTHRDSGVTTYESIRDDLVGELRTWHAETSSLPLIRADAIPPSPASRSSFRSQEWYDLLYHNGILMLFRPSPSICDASRNSVVLQHVYDSSESAILLYASLHRTGRINYSWVTLHSVFIAGLSYIYALRNHLQHVQGRQHGQQHAAHFPLAYLQSTPTINQVVNTTRACSKVLVAVSERWAVARSCSEVFDKLSDAVVADVVDSQMSEANISSPTTARTAQPGHDVGTAFPSSDMDGALNGQPGEPGFFNMTVDNTLRDCFGDLQNICYDQYHSDAIVQLSQDWLVGLGEAPERYF